MQKTQVQSLGWEDPLEKQMATHSSNFAWDNPKDRGVWQATVHEAAMTEHACLLPAPLGATTSTFSTGMSLRGIL